MDRDFRNALVAAAVVWGLGTAVQHLVDKAVAQDSDSTLSTPDYSFTPPPLGPGVPVCASGQVVSSDGSGLYCTDYVARSGTASASSTATYSSSAGTANRATSAATADALSGSGAVAGTVVGGGVYAPDGFCSESRCGEYYLAYRWGAATEIGGCTSGTVRPQSSGWLCVR